MRFIGQTALITGAGRGLGAALAAALAQEGAHVIALSKSRKRLEALDDAVRSQHPQRESQPPITLLPFDLEDLEAIPNLAPSIAQRFGALDIFIGNAALLGPAMPFHHIEPHAWDQVLGVNLCANQRLLQTLDPLLRQSPKGRALVISSAIEPKPYFAPYSVSKIALEAMVVAYAREIPRSSPYLVMALRPGILQTQLRAQAFPGEDPQRLPQPAHICPPILDLLTSAPQHIVFDIDSTAQKPVARPVL